MQLKHFLKRKVIVLLLRGKNVREMYRFIEQLIKIGVEKLFFFIRQRTY